MTCLASRNFVSLQSFLPVGIGEATPLITCLASGNFVSLHSLSYLWVSGRQCRWCLILATPSASYTGDAFKVLAMPGAVNMLTLALALTLTLTLVDAWGRDTCRSGKLRVSPAPSTWHFPYG